MKLIACAILTLSGAVCVGFASVSTSHSDIRVFGEGLGILLTLAGAAMFAIEYVRSWSSTNVENTIARARIEAAKTLPNRLDAPELLP